MNSILLVPSVRRGNGSGHIVRCFALARELGRAAAVYLPEAPGPNGRSATELALSYPGDFERCAVVTRLEPSARFGLVLLDQRESSAEDYLKWSAHGPVACLDEGGPARDSADYTIDILLSSGARRGASAANSSGLGFLTLPASRRETPTAARKVLVSFGGEDPAGLADRFMDAAMATSLARADGITVVSGALSAGSEHSWQGVTRVGPVQDLRERLAGFDLVVTQFGLTAFEAAWAGCAVLLYNPGPAHERLSRRAGFASLGTGRASPRRLQRFLDDFPSIALKSARAAPASRESLASLLSSLRPRHARPCPSCGSRAGTAVYRDARKTYLRCPACSLVRMAYFAERENPYVDDAYFNEAYKAQYGRTYIEDMPKLRAMARSRLDRIEALLGADRGDSVVLDVGCAYGAFVAEAQSRSWTAIGTDVSPTAVAYVRDTIGAPAFVADFSAQGTSGFYPRQVDCLSMWYVIEHFDDLGFVLDRAAAMLRRGGVFAFSTPSSSGISARKDPAAFWERSPDDHFTVWSPKAARAILKRRGFTVQRIVVTGHHPERFPLVPAGGKGLRWLAASAWSRLFGWGDTFECYATKD